MENGWCFHLWVCLTEKHYILLALIRCWKLKYYSIFNNCDLPRMIDMKNPVQKQDSFSIKVASEPREFLRKKVLIR